MIKQLSSFKSYYLHKNPVFVSLMSICPLLTATASVNAAFYMSCCIAVVIVLSEVIISMFRKVIPKDIAIHFTVIVTSTIVTIVYLITRAFYPGNFALLAYAIPLLVVNCLVRTKVRKFALNEDVVRSFLDGLLTSISIFITLMIISVFREFFSTGSLLVGKYYISIFPKGFFPLFFGEPAGAFFAVGIISFIVNLMRKDHDNSKIVHTEEA